MPRMALFNPFKRQDAQDAGAPTAASPADQVAQARRRARQRLAGAVVLLGLGIVGFPLLFETAPRPIPVDLPIEVPRKDGLPPLQVPPARGDAASTASARPGASAVRGQVTTEAPSEPRAPEAPDAPVVAAPSASAVTAAGGAEPPKPAVKAAAAASSPRAVEPARPDASNPPSAAKPPTAVAEAASAPAKPRYIVQVGAYAEPSTLQQARAKVEKLGLKTYTQVVETDGGKRTRVRVGPFASKDEADKAAAKLKATGLPVAILAL